MLVQVRRKTSEPTSAPKATGLPIADAVNALGRLYVLELVPVGGPPAERGRIVEHAPAEAFWPAPRTAAARRFLAGELVL